MARARLEAIGRACARHPVVVIALWLVLAVAVLGTARAVGSASSDDAGVPGSDSARATELARSSELATGAFVVSAGGTERLDDATLDRISGALDAAPHVASVAAPQRSADGRVATLRARTDLRPADLSVAEARAIDDAAHHAAATADQGKVEVSVGGDVGRKLSRQPTHDSEAFGLAVAVVVLFVVLGGFVPMLLPLASALLGVAVGVGLITLLSHAVDVPTVATTLGVMIGLGLGIDYALFLINRFRAARATGLDVVAAVGVAQRTSGAAVLFAGATVVAALASLLVAGIGPVTGLGLSAAAVVVVALAAATTLLPALIGAAGARADGRRAARDGGDAGAGGDDAAAAGGVTAGAAPAGAWARWAAWVVRRRWLAGGAALVALLALSIPALSLDLGQQDPGAMPKDTTQRQAYDTTARAFGPGANGPLLIAAEPGHAGDLAALRTTLSKTPGVAAVSAPSDGTVTVTPTTGPSDPATADLVGHLRDDVLPGWAHVGGTTAVQADLAAQISDQLPLIIGVVVAISIVLLLVAFRSVVLPLKAALMTLLSVAAAYGVLVAVFQDGHGASLIGLDGPVPVVSYVPMVMFAILFGLSMDYEVFLLSSIQEHHDAGEPTRTAIASGVSATGRIITAAALIMVSVFASFVLNGDPLVKMFGVGLATAIAIDATVVRCVLVPAAMALLDRANWWWPGQILPRS